MVKTAPETEVFVLDNKEKERVQIKSEGDFCNRISLVVTIKCFCFVAYKQKNLFRPLLYLDKFEWSKELSTKYKIC